MLENMGFRTVSAENSLHFKFAYSFLPHINAVLIERSKPKKACDKISKHFRKLHEKSKQREKVPVILVVADEQEEKLFKFDYDFTLHKPLSEEALADVLKKIGLHPLKGNIEFSP